MLIRLLLLLPLALASAATHADDELFRFKGQTYKPENLSTRMSQLYGAMLTEHYAELQSLVDEMVFDVYVEQEAKRLGKPIREVGFGLLKVEDPNEDEVRNYYLQNQQQIGQPFDLVQERLLQAMRRQAMVSKREAILSRIKSEGDFKLLASPPPLPEASIDLRGRPFKGNPDAPITLVEFGDFQCPNCKRAATLIDTLMKKYPDMLKVYFMDFPINRSGISRKVAVGGVCALAQGKFWPYHDMAYAQQDRLRDDSSLELAKSLELDMEAFRACLEEPTSRAQVERSFDEGRRLGVNATPTLFVDGKPFLGKHLLRDLGDYIRRKRSESDS